MSEREECYNVKARRREWRGEEKRKILIYDFNSTFSKCDTGKLRPAFVTIFFIALLPASFIAWRRRSHHVVTMAEFLRHFRVWKWKIYSDYNSSSSDYGIEEKWHRNEIERISVIKIRFQYHYRRLHEFIFCRRNKIKNRNFPIPCSCYVCVYAHTPKANKKEIEGNAFLSTMIFFARLIAPLLIK